MVARRRPHQRNLARPLSPLEAGSARRPTSATSSIAAVGYLLLYHFYEAQHQIHQVRQVLSVLNLSEPWVDHLISEKNQGWRLLMMFGAIPALLTLPSAGSCRNRKNGNASAARGRHRTGPRRT